MTTGKTLLIVGGVAVGVVVLMKLVAPPAAPRTTVGGAVSQLGSIVSGIQGLGSGLSSLFSGSTAGSASNAPAVVSSGGQLFATRAEWQNISDYDKQATPGSPVYGIAGIDY